MSVLNGFFDTTYAVYCDSIHWESFLTLESAIEYAAEQQFYADYFSSGYSWYAVEM